MRSMLIKLLVLSVTVTGLVVTTSANAQKAKSAPRKALADEFSGQGYGMAGCGLGSVVFGQKRGIVQVVASTLNGTFASQTFGMTSGTSNCAADENGGEMAVNVFIDSNRLAMQNDVAKGQGETLEAFFDVSRCNERAAIGETLQQHYSEIFRGENSNVDIANTIRKTIRADKKLANDCPNLG